MNRLNPEDFGPIKLSQGAHSGPYDGMCAMEMVSFLAGEKWSDAPKCTDRRLAMFVRSLNDSLGQEFRDRLLPLIPMLIGTAPSEDEVGQVIDARQSAMHNMMLHGVFPFLLELLGHDAYAWKLRRMDEDYFSIRDRLSQELKHIARTHMEHPDTWQRTVGLVLYKTAETYGPDYEWKHGTPCVDLACTVGTFMHLLEVTDLYEMQMPVDTLKPITATQVMETHIHRRHVREQALDMVIDHLTKVIEAGPHGTRYTDLQKERTVQVQKELVPCSAE